MGNTNRYEGGIGFGGDSREVQAQEYRTIPKSSLSQEQQATYVSAIQKLGGFNGTKWEAKITKYFNENDYVIDLQQEGLNQFDLKKIFNQYSDDQEDTITKVGDESYKKYLNSRSAETSKRYDSGLEGDSLNVSNDEQLEVESNYPYPTRLPSESDYGDKSVLSDWLLIEKNSQEHGLLIQGIKDKGVIPSLKLLNQIHPEIRRLKQNKEVSGEYLEFINATREFYGLAPYGSISEELAEVNQPEINLEVVQEPTLVVEPESGTTPASEGLAEGGVNETKKLTRVDFGPMPEDPYNIRNNDLGALNNLFDVKRDEFPNSQYVDIRNWTNWTPIEVVAPENPNGKWLITTGVNHELVGDFDNETEANTEFDRIKNEDKQKALDLLRKARNFAIGVDLDTPWSDVIDVSREPVMGFESAGTPLLDAETNSEVATEIVVDEHTLKNGRLKDRRVIDPVLNSILNKYPYFQDDNTDPSETNPSRLGVETETLLEEIPNITALEKELEQLGAKEVQEKGGTLARIEQGKYIGEPDIEINLNSSELDILSERAQEAINKYQLFHQSFSKEHRTPAIQEQYRKLEKEAWDRVEELAHKLGGRIIELPRGLEFNKEYDEDIDIKTRDKLNSDLGYKFNQEGQITHIEINGNTIQLNRPRTVDELLNGDRPARILYHSGEQILNEDPFKKYYKGYWIKGLNLNTIQDMERELSGNQFPQPDIIDETITPSDIIDDPNSIQYYRNLEPIDLPETKTNQELNGPPVRPIFQVKQGNPNFNLTKKYSLEDKSKQDPWSTESRGETEFDKIFADSLNKNKEIQKDNEMPDKRFEQAEVVEDLPIDNPDRGSLYYQEIQLWNNIQALENRQKENPKDESVKVELDKAKQAYQEFRSTVSSAPEQDKFKQFLELRELYAQAESENTRGRIQKLFRLKRKNNSELEDIRSQYNEALEVLLKTETSIDVEGKIKEMFSDEVQRLSGERVVQTKELQEKNQSGLDRALNPLKDRIFNWYIKNKSAVGAINLGLFATSTLLAFTGAGIPLAGAVNTLRHTIAYPMAAASGISSRELIRSKFEDENTNLNLDIKKFNLKTNFEFLKFKGGITKLVDKSLQENYIQNASDEDLSKLVSTLESYYGLNGGKFTELSQQKAYEMGLNELGARLERANNQSTDEQEISNESNAVYGLDYKFDFKNTKEFKIKTVDGLVTRISQDRISALNDQKNKRLVANVAGTALGSSLLFNLVAQDLQFNKPNLGDSASTTGEMRPKPTTGDHTPELKSEGAGEGGTGGAGAPEAGADTINPLTQPSTPTPGEGFYPPAPDLPSPEEALRMRQVAAAAEKAQQLAQDVSSLDSGETIWGEIAKQLGTDASQGQIQEAVEKYLGSIKGQDTIFKLAQQTEGGRELLSQWGIDNAGEVAGLSKDQLYEVSKYLGEGKLDGLTELSLDNLNALEQAEYVAPSPTEAPTIEPGSTETPAPPAGTEDIGSKPPAPSSPPVTEAPVEAPVNTSQFTKSLSEAIGANNLTDSQIGSVLEAYADTEQGRESLYNMIITSEANNSNISDLLTEYNVIDIYDFAELSDNQLYALAQEVGVENLDKLPGFELNEIILSKFEDAPDTVELVKGLSPLDAVQRYIANELGDLPYDSSLSKNIVDNILDTPEGKDWFLKSITENPDGAPAKGDIRFMNARLFFSRNGITQGSDIDWNKLDQLRNGFVKHKIFWQDFPFKVDDKTVNLSLSRLLKPGPMPGIKDAVRQVLTRQ